MPTEGTTMDFLELMNALLTFKAALPETNWDVDGEVLELRVHVGAENAQLMRDAVEMMADQ